MRQCRRGRACQPWDRGPTRWGSGCAAALGRAEARSQRRCRSITVQWPAAGKEHGANHRRPALAGAGRRACRPRLAAGSSSEFLATTKRGLSILPDDSEQARPPNTFGLAALSALLEQRRHSTCSIAACRGMPLPARTPLPRPPLSPCHGAPAQLAWSPIVASLCILVPQFAPISHVAHPATHSPTASSFHLWLSWADVHCSCPATGATSCLHAVGACSPYHGAEAARCWPSINPSPYAQCPCLP